MIWIIILTFISYVLTLRTIVILTEGFEINDSVDLLFAALVFVVALLSITGWLLFMRNYGQKAKDSLITLGSNLITLSYELMIGTIAIGILILIITNANDTTNNKKLENQIEVLEERIESLEKNQDT